MHLPVNPIIDMLSQRLLALDLNQAPRSCPSVGHHEHPRKRGRYHITVMSASPWPPTQLVHDPLSPTELNRLTHYLKTPTGQDDDDTYEEFTQPADPDSSPSDEAVALVNFILASRVSHHGPLSRSVVESTRNSFARSWLQVMVGLASENDRAEARVRAFLPKETRQITCDFAKSLDRELFRQELARFTRNLSPTNGESLDSSSGDVRPPRSLTSAAVAYIRSWLLSAAITRFDMPDADYSMDQAHRIMVDSVRLACGLKQHILSSDDEDEDDDIDVEDRVAELLTWFDGRMRRYVDSAQCSNLAAT